MNAYQEAAMNKENMRAIEISQPGSPDVLRETSRSVPTITSNEVLIKVVHAGVNRPDVMQRAGLYPPPPGASDIPGLEVAGEIIALGDRCQQWKVGDKVCALVTGGGYAEYAAAHEDLCLPIPRGFSLVEASALPETFFTVWSNIFDRGKLVSGEKLLVHGGSSGIGTSAIQLASAFGFEVFTTAGSNEKCEICEKLGAKKAINYKTQDFVEEIKKYTENIGVNVILDMVAGDYLQRNIQCLADDGRIVIIAFQGGIKTNLTMTDILRRRLTITGSTLRPRSNAFKANIRNALLQNVWPLMERGLVRPLIHAQFALNQADQAHSLMESSQHVGKIVLDV
jgi:NADPH2:quinone reductase